MRVRRGSGASRGFTLMEVTIALAISGVLLLTLRGLAEVLGMHGARTTHAANAQQDEANAERTLRLLVARMEMTTGDVPFVGSDDEARFSSWCEVPRGWLESCVVRLRVRPKPASSRGVEVEASLSTGERLVFAASTTGHLRYLLSARDGGMWIPAWRSSVTLPGAIGVILERDTLVLRVSDRG
jgi:prepilin-type N-terminal cleavage/methylation domain-containing protein